MKRGGAVFLLGMTRRTGTNFAYQLLKLHPDLAGAKTLLEDFALQDAQLLLEYARRTRAHWNPDWGLGPEAETRLVRALGVGIYMFIRDVGFEVPASDDKRLLLKTPSVANLEHFFEFFPEASLLILVRDGRDAVESGVRSFGWSYERSTQAWCRAARAVLEFDRQQGGRHRYRIVRYEDLVTDLVGQLREILTFLDLDPAAYDFEAARNLPIYGSSTARGERAQLHWKPVTKTEDFKPLGRWQGWSRYRRRRFAWSAGELMSRLGYEMESAPAWWERAEHRLVDHALRWEDRWEQALAYGRALRRGQGTSGS